MWTLTNDGKPTYRVDVLGVHLGYRAVLIDACADACLERMKRDARAGEAY